MNGENRLFWWLLPAIAGAFFLTSQILYQNMRADDIRQTQKIEDLSKEISIVNYNIQMMLKERQLMLENYNMRLQRINERLTELEAKKK